MNRTSLPLRAVLNAFENETALSLNQLSHQLGITPAMLDSMIAYWVRKGRLRESTSTPQCTTCGSARGCPFIMKMPRTYELVTTSEPSDANPPCSCRS